MHADVFVYGLGVWEFQTDGKDAVKNAAAEKRQRSLGESSYPFEILRQLPKVSL